MKEMEKEKDENGRHSEKEMAVKRFGKENVKKKDVFFQVPPSIFFCMPGNVFDRVNLRSQKNMSGNVITCLLVYSSYLFLASL